MPLTILGTGDKAMAKEANFSVGASANKWSPVAWWYMLGRRVRDEGGWERTVLLNLDGGRYVIYIYICMYTYAMLPS